MNHNPTLLALFFPAHGTSSLLGLLEKFTQAASWFDADLHLLAPKHLRKRLESELSKLRRPTGARPIVENLLHDDYFSEIMATASKLSADFICLENGDVGQSRTKLARLKQSVLAQTTTPVLILPKRLPDDLTTLDSIVVPISGEQRNSEALRQALKIAKNTKTSVTLAHASQTGAACSCDASGLESVADEIQHEYVRHLDKVVSEASPDSSFQERQRVTHFAHLSGTTPKAITTFLRQSPRSLLVLEWRGVLIGGHAATLKALLKGTHAPILVVKMAHEKQSRLKIGRDFKAA